MSPSVKQRMLKMRNNQGQLPAHLTSNAVILQLLIYSEGTDLKVKIDRSIEKCWHFDPSLKPVNFNNHSYVLIDATPRDKEKVVQRYLHHPVPNMDIKSVKAIYNPKLHKQFEVRLQLLEERHNNAIFQPKWKNENNSEWRSKVIELVNKLSSPYKDSDAPHVSLLPLWHGTDPGALQSIFGGGYASLATTDNGFFGKGIYGSHEAEYAYRVYSKGALILNWVSFYSAYPVIHGDMPKLQEKDTII